jgi:ElaB/YqjD/DUF883 family membrane-anchored ribosome-binding protein
MNHDTQNLAKDTRQVVERGADKAQQMASKAADKAADKADQTINAAQDVAADAEHSIQAGLNQIRDAVPATLSRAAHQAEDLARAGIDKARLAGQSMASQAGHMRDQTASYVREEPTKALLMALAAGAFATLLIGWATRGNGHSRH